MNHKLIQKIKNEPSTEQVLDQLHHASIQLDIHDPYSNPNIENLKELYDDGLAIRSQHLSVVTYNISRDGVNVLQDIAQDKIIAQQKRELNQHDTDSTPKRTQASRLESKEYEQDPSTKHEILNIFDWITVTLIVLTSFDFIFINGVTAYHYFALMIVYIMTLIVTVSLE